MPEFVHYYHNGKDAHGTYEVEAKEGDTHLGYAELRYAAKPIPCYVLSTLEVEEGYQGQGLGTKLLGFIEAYLKEMNAPGLLFDPPYVSDDEHPDIYPFVSAWYSRRGWTEPEKQWFRFYNLPPGIDMQIFGNFEQVYEDF